MDGRADGRAGGPFIHSLVLALSSAFLRAQAFELISRREVLELELRDRRFLISY